ncbi:hypothetical protein F4703DRAFT_1868277 [Phycomyces blakesleeanus]
MLYNSNMSKRFPYGNEHRNAIDDKGNPWFMDYIVETIATHTEYLGNRVSNVVRKAKTKTHALYSLG